MSRLPILCYHNIGPAPVGSMLALLHVAEARLDRQLWALKRLGLRGVSMSEGLARLRAGTRGNQVVLTFDDGYRDTLTAALPLLRHHGFRATCFVVSERIGQHNRWDDELQREPHALMTREELGDWVACGMELGSHSCTHPRLPALDEGEAAREIVESRAQLQRTFGVPVDHFAYPFGALSPAIAALVKRAGYVSAVTTRSGVARAADDRHALPRMFVHGQRGLGRFLFDLAAGAIRDDRS